ncbi:hypothetical protein GCM10027176_32980 [Actinoallomurus bryophytorum]|uniref:Putative RDD family membrane protein YckC n=1 Tax=Actinoallomurus bryophytorum TaxID=1490222 RepID=A0A543CN29_9ACTN|nr:RDD family protein [Actinoallomurus bryophytorum]TQL98501.1 putative RDD family membrane protein YckC [Actinoallomurus bryophytorum]
MEPPQWHRPGGPEVPASGPFYGQAPPGHGTAVPTRDGPPPGWYAPRWEYSRKSRRLIAGLIDGSTLNTIAHLGTVSLYIGLHRERHGIAYGVADTLIYLILMIFIFVLPQARWGQTLGKRAMDIRVVRAGDGGAIGYGQSTLRELVFAPLNLIIGLGNLVVVIVVGLLSDLDPAWILWDPRRQALHDKVARTVVVQAGPGIPNPYRDGK